MKLKLEIIGNLGSDAIIRDVNNSKAISFSVAHSEKYKNAQGVEVENTTWVKCTIWKKTGKSTEIVKYLKKGTLVAIEGSPSVRVYKNQQGEIVASMECRVNFIKLLSTKEVPIFNHLENNYNSNTIKDTENEKDSFLDKTYDKAPF